MDGPESDRPPLALRAGLDATAGLIQLLGARRYWLSDRLANATCALQPRRRAATAANYQAALGVGRVEARRLAQESYREYGRTAIDFLFVHRLPRRKLMPLVRVWGRENLDRAIGEGRGVIVVMIHVGSWDIAGAYAAALGFPLTAVMADTGSPALEQLVVWARAKLGVRVVTASRSPRAMLAAIRDGGWVGLISDIPGDTPSVSVDFMGRRTRVSSAPGMLAARTGAPLLPVVCVRTGNGTYLGEVHPPVHVGRGTDPAEALSRLMPVFEAAVRRWPEQWFPFDDGRLEPPEAG